MWWMSWARRRFLLPSLMKPLEASIMKMPLRACGVLLVEHDDAGGNAGAVEEVRRQADDALDVAAPDDLAADVGLGAAAEQHAVRQDDRALAGALEAGEDVEQKGVVAVLRRRDAELEALELVVGRVEAVAPRLGRERRIGDDEVEGLERAVCVLEVRARRACCPARSPPSGSRAGSCSSAPAPRWRCPSPGRRARGRARCGSWPRRAP